ncbi:unnamed protein product [Calicophoron daubneyi]|uniref:LanC-like protein 3 homolog n=1 Tax=Calicophoron daubneyi TaxID=300641 RepID=A0AAV2TF48_CALDB
MGARYFRNPYTDVVDAQQPPVVGPESALERSVNCLRICFEHVVPSALTFDGCLYTGYIGIAWASLMLLRKQLPQTTRDFLMERSTLFVTQALMHSSGPKKQSKPPNEDELSLLLGNAGIWMTAAMLFHETKNLGKRDQYIQAYASLAPQFKPETLYSQGSDEFFVGKAGFLAGIAQLRAYTGETVLSDAHIYTICDSIIQSGQNYAKNQGSPCPLMYAYYGTEYLGAGHGLAGILFALMLFPGYLKQRPQSEELVRRSLAYMIQVTPANTGNLPSATDEVSGRYRRSDSQLLVHWCHGATGAVLAYARAYVLWKDPLYLNECRRCADTVWERGLLKKGPGICHGVAGSGYVFLLLYRLTGEVIYLHRASAFADFMNSEEFKLARRPDSPYSLYEGLVGTACFYADLFSPLTAAFPLMDPLWDQPATLPVV